MQQGLFMNRIEQKFQELKKAGRKGLVGYLTAGDPSPEESERNIRAAIESGLDVLELGMPFSDPTADGPTIQAASHRALKAGMTLPRALQMVRDLRRDCDVPIVLFGYVNPLFRRGYARVCAEAAEAGVDGMLVVDLPFEEKDELCAHLDRSGVFFIPLVAPTTSTARAAKVLLRAQGFVYYIMVKGVTGARQGLAADLASQVSRLRGCTRLPIAVGFGIQGGEQARAAAQAADAVVVGSALVEAARKGTLGALVKELRQALE
jgi:tryptophan synthase alpha chain